MSIKQVNPYINLNGSSEKAIKLYESALGAKTDNIMRYGDVESVPSKPEHKNLIMHATLRIGEGQVMIADAPPDYPAPADSNVTIALHFSGLDAEKKAFDALAVGGKITMPLQDTFWGARFGMLTDIHGVRWMFNCELKKA